MTKLSLENIEFIKILASSDATILQAGMNDATRHRLDDEIGTILREYYRENTMGLKTGWTEKLSQAGIDEDAGKAAIACARRLGIDIS
jgi:lysophospholipase L1-like esterase